LEDRPYDRDIPVSGSVPVEATAEFPRLEVPKEGDLEVVGRQLGRPPSGEVFIAARCRHGCPTVILTMPSAGSGGPTPPLLWLTCPHACRFAGGLESGGGASRFAGMLEEPGALREEFLADEARFEAVQVGLARRVSEEAARRVEGRGAAGGRPGDVKCLHAHLAYRLASGRGVVGGWCLEELVKKAGRACEHPPETCVD
jgi:uncharacterized protein